MAQRMQTVADLIVKTAHAGLALQREDGSLEPGHNGPHRDVETPCRNTGHWMTIWGKALSLSGDRRFREAGERAADYVLRPVHRPSGHTVHHRSRPGKDKCNGVMGPTFSIEAAVAGGVFLERDDLLKLAADLIAQHEFSAERQLWFVREIDGAQLPVDPTLNHQIWFASAVARAQQAGISVGREALTAFIAALPRLVRLRPDGRFCHLAGSMNPMRNALAGVKDRLRPPTGGEAKKEIAYHTYNLFPLALIEQALPGSLRKDSAFVTRPVAYTLSTPYLNHVSQPAFIEPYIPAGFPLSFVERAVIDRVLGGNDLDLQTSLLGQQVALNYDFERDLLVGNSIDPLTQASRFYEFIFFDDLEMKIPNLADRSEQARASRVAAPSSEDGVSVGG